MRSYIYSYWCGAGRRADERFGELAQRWRRRVLRPVQIVARVLALALIVGARFEHHYVSWLLGLALGGLLALYVFVRESPPTHIENWRTGAQGERRTARALWALRRDGWVVLHDLPDRAGTGNVDHVVVGPAGVFVLDSKWPGGDASVEGDLVHVRRRDDETASYTMDRLAPAIRGLAVRLKQDIEAETHVRLNVRAVAVFWGGFGPEVVQGNRVVFVAGEQLVPWLRQQAPTMVPDIAARVVAGIQRQRVQERRS